MAQPNWLAVRMRIITIRCLIRYGARYSATRQFFSTIALHLLRQGFCTLVLFIYSACDKIYSMYMFRPDAQPVSR